MQNIKNNKQHGQTNDSSNSIQILLHYSTNFSARMKSLKSQSTDNSQTKTQKTQP